MTAVMCGIRLCWGHCRMVEIGERVFQKLHFFYNGKCDHKERLISFYKMALVRSLLWFVVILARRLDGEQPSL